MPKDQADAYWATNFGFGIVRQALKEGFALTSAPARNLRGRETPLVRITAPGGAETLFGFAAESGFIKPLFRLVKTLNNARNIWPDEEGKTHSGEDDTTPDQDQGPAHQ